MLPSGQHISTMCSATLNLVGSREGDSKKHTCYLRIIHRAIGKNRVFEIKTIILQEYFQDLEQRVGLERLLGGDRT